MGGEPRPTSLRKMASFGAKLAESIPQGLNRLRKSALLLRFEASKKLAGAKAHSFYWLYSARLKSCPVTKRSRLSFSAACGARVDSGAFMPGINPRHTLEPSFPQPVKPHS
jgi:hypothetical protein